MENILMINVIFISFLCDGTEMFNINLKCNKSHEWGLRGGLKSFPIVVLEIKNNSEDDISVCVQYQAEMWQISVEGCLRSFSIFVL